MWSRGSWGGGKGTAVPLSTKGSTRSSTTSQALEWYFQPQLHFWPTSVSKGLYEDSKLLQEESKLKYTVPSHKVWTLSFIFHLLSKATCMWTWQTREWLAWSCWKPMHEPMNQQMCLGNISRAVWDGSQGNLNGFSGRWKEVYQQLWIVVTETSVSLPCLGAHPSNKIFPFTPTQGQPSLPSIARQAFVPSVACLYSTNALDILTL